MQKTDLVVPTKRNNTLSQVVVAALVLSSANAVMAADNITALGEGATANISAALTVALAIFAVGIGIIGTFKGYQYLKSGVTKA